MLKIVSVATAICAIGIGSLQEAPTNRHTALQEEDARSRSQASQYYDLRERIAASLTFEWVCESSRIYSKQYLSTLAESETAESDNHSPSDDIVVSEYDPDHLQVQGLRSTYRIQRTPKLTRFSGSEILPLLSRTKIRKYEEPLRWSEYYLGETGEVVISKPFDGEASVVHIGLGGFNGLGLPSPFLGVNVGSLVLLGGVSPFRLFGVDPASWRLSEVSETTWVFELQPDEQKRKSMTGFLKFEQVKVHLSRKHGDAVAQLEIRYSNGYTKWTTQEYKQIQGVWFPSQVICEYTASFRSGWQVYELVNTSASLPVVVEIPDGSPVQDWSLEGLKLWLRGKSSCESLDTQWNAELLRSLWQRIEKTPQPAQERASNPTQDRQ